MLNALAVVAAIWIACGIGAAGLIFAQFDDLYGWDDQPWADYFVAGMIGITGPIGLAVALGKTGFGFKHGWRLLPKRGR